MKKIKMKAEARLKEKKMSKEEKTTMVITTILCLIPMLLSLTVYSKLPEQLPIHFDANWNVDGYAPKFLGAIGIPIGIGIANCFLHIVLNQNPKKENVSKTLMKISIWIIPVITVVMQVSAILMSLGYDIKAQRLMPIVTGIIIIACGNYLPKCKHNYMVGIRLPWTLSGEDNWNKTHHMAGYIWITGGFIMAIVGLFKVNTAAITITVLAIITIIPSIYSYGLYRQEKSK